MDIRSMLRRGGGGSGGTAAATTPAPVSLEQTLDQPEAAAAGLVPTIEAQTALGCDAMFAAYAEAAVRKGRALGWERGLGMAGPGLAGLGGGGGGAGAHARGTQPVRRSSARGARPPLGPVPLTQAEDAGPPAARGRGGLLDLGSTDDDSDDDFGLGVDTADDGRGGRARAGCLAYGSARPPDPARRPAGEEDARRFLRSLAHAAGPARALRRSQALQLIAIVRAHALHRDPSLSLDAAAALRAQLSTHPLAVFIPGDVAAPARIAVARTGPAAGAAAPWSLADGGLAAHPWDQLDDGGGVLGALGGGGWRPGGFGAGGGGLASHSAQGAPPPTPFASLLALARAARDVAAGRPWLDEVHPALPHGLRGRGGARPHQAGEVALFAALVAHLAADAAPRLAAHAATAGDARAPPGRRAALLRHSLAWRICFDSALGGGWAPGAGGGRGGWDSPPADLASPVGGGENLSQPQAGGGRVARGLASGLGALVSALVEAVAGAAAWGALEAEQDAGVQSGGAYDQEEAGDHPQSPAPTSASVALDLASAAAVSRDVAAEPAADLLRLLLALTGAAEGAGDFAPAKQQRVGGGGGGAGSLAHPARSAPGGGNERAALDAALASAALARGGPVRALADAVEAGGCADPGAGLRAVLAEVEPADAARLAGGVLAVRLAREGGRGAAGPLAAAAAAWAAPGSVTDPAAFTPPPVAVLAALAADLDARPPGAASLQAAGGHADQLASLVAGLTTAGAILAADKEAEVKAGGGKKAAVTAAAAVGTAVDDAADGAIAGLLDATASRLALSFGSRAALAAARTVAANRATFW